MDVKHQTTSAFSWTPSAADLAALALFPMEQRRGMARALVSIAPDLNVLVADENNQQVVYSYHNSVMHVMPPDGSIPDWIAAPGFEAGVKEARFARYKHAVELLIGTCVWGRANALRACQCCLVHQIH
jgi:hypothetical protein